MIAILSFGCGGLFGGFMMIASRLAGVDDND